MAQVVCAYATSHILFSPKGVEDRARRVVEGMKELGRRAAAARPDVLLIIAGDHMFNFNLALQTPFCVGVADEYTGLGDMAIPPRPFKGHREFAETLVRFAARRGFDLAKAEDLRPDHGVALPLLFIKPWGRIPVVPLFVNINMDPVPSPARCQALAGVLREAIEKERPARERVAVIGSGGLSHWLNVPGMGKVAEAFDQRCIETIAAGRAADIAGMTAEEILAQCGNGGLELMFWMMMASMVPGKTGEKVYYEPIAPWMTGMGGVAMNV